MRAGTRSIIVVVLLATAVGFGPEARGQAPFVRGDVDASGTIDMTDPIASLQWMFLGTYESLCLGAMDANDSGAINLSDPIYVLGYLFLGTDTQIPAPFPSCGPDPTPDFLGCLYYDHPQCRETPRLTGASALSSHWVEVAFVGPVPVALRDPSAYSITSDDGILEVLEVREVDDPRRVLLATDAQRETEYMLFVSGALGPATGGDGAGAQGPGGSIVFQGSDDAEPRPISAISLGSTPVEGKVLLTFSEPMLEGLLDTRFYKIAMPDLEIRRIDPSTIGVPGTTVIITTDWQRNLLYSLKVTNVKSKAGAFVVDPTRNVVTFDGVPPVDTDPPRLLSATPTSNTTIILNFSEPLRPGSEDPRNYIIRCFDPFTASPCPNLEIQNTQLASLGTQVVLTTLPQSPAFQYTVEIVNRCGSPVDRDNCVQDVQENPIGTTGNTATFTGLDRDRPYLASAISLGPDSLDPTKAYVLLTFSEPVLDGAEIVAFYSIANPDLEIFDAELSLDGLTVRLTTEAQDAISYTVRATNILSRAGGFALDPTRSSATFTGIPPLDTVKPRVLSAVSISTTSVLVTFSEPILPGAADPANFVITCGSPCSPLAVTAATLSHFGTQVVLQTLPQTAGVEYEVEVIDRCPAAKDACVEDLQENPIDPAASKATFVMRGAPIFSSELPRVIGAISIANNKVIVTFSKPMGPSAAISSNYYIVQTNVNPEVGYLAVMGARFLSPDRTDVELTTLSQSEVAYSVTAVNVRDVSGNHLAPTVIVNGIVVNPAEAVFPGTPPNAPYCIAIIDGGNGKAETTADGDDIQEEPLNGTVTPGSIVVSAGDDELLQSTPGGDDEVDCIAEPTITDTDGDGLTDSEEQKGYIIRIQLFTGDSFFREVTSSPFIPDTDGDGLDDEEERRRNSDPRNVDTDSDKLLDPEELNFLFSDMNSQDSDGDTVDDQDEVEFFKTNVLVADSDGDGFEDGREIYDLVRDPRIADLPRQGIDIGEMTIRLDERFTFTDEDGETVTQTSNTSVSVSQASSSTLSRTDAQMHSFLIEGQVRGGQSDQLDLKFIQGQLTVSSNNEYSTQTGREAAQALENAFASSLDKGREISGSTAVTREVVGASIEVNVTLRNLSDVALSIRNVEISALLTDPADRTKLIPVATLIPKTTLLTGESAVFNLGPFDPTRGPIIFASLDVFPKLVEDLMRNPRGLIFKIANYDLTDEYDRNFSFASQVAHDRTTGIVIDYGDGTVERYLVGTGAALAWARDELRCSRGPRYGQPCVDGTDCDGFPCEAGQLIGGMVGFPGTGTQLGIPLEYALHDILGLEKNSTVDDGILAGANGIVQSVAAGDDVQLVPTGINGVPDDTIVIVAGANGVLDTTPGGDDTRSVVTGYETSPSCGASTPPRIIDGGNLLANTTAEGDDLQLVTVGTAVTAGAEIIDPGPNGVIDTTPKGPGNDDVFSGPGVACTSATHCPGGACDGPEVLVRIKNRKLGQFGRTWKIVVPRLPAEIADDDSKISTDFGSITLRAGETIGFAFVRDRDRDGLTSQEEFMFGSRDDDQDSDDDGLDDFAEVKVGWLVNVDGSALRRVFPDPGSPDSDGDGLTDPEEKDLRSIVTATDFGRPSGEPFSTDPRVTDTDEDLVGDDDEVEGYLVGTAIRDPRNVIIAGTDGVADSKACNNATTPCDDIQVLPVGSRGHARRVVVAPGPDGVLHLSSAAASTDTLVTTGNLKANTQAGGDDRQFVAKDATVAAGGVIIRPGANGIYESVPGVDDVIQAGDKIVRTDPLTRDFDSDGLSDGNEQRIGSYPNDPSDGNNFSDVDDDGLTDAEEESVGWNVSVTALGGSISTRLVFSNPFIGDSDFDDLPDLLERILGTDPTSSDTDADGLTDYDELAEDTFAQYQGLSSLHGGFVLDGSRSAALGTSPTKVDTDADGVSDSDELAGYVIRVPGSGVTKRVFTDPLRADSDDDFLNDKVERDLKTDGTASDSDGDGRVDGDECCPSGGTCTPATIAACSGGNPLTPDRRVTVVFSQLNASWGGGGGEWWWRLYVQKSGESFPGTLVSAPHLATSSCFGYSSTCKWCAQADLVGIALNNSRTITLNPGQGIVLSGVVAELQLGACSRSSDDNIQLGRDAGGDDDQCSMVVPVKSFTYEDLSATGFLTQTVEFEKGNSNNQAGCTGNVTIEIQVQ